MSLPVSSRCNRTPRNRSDRIPAMLGDAGLDALVAVSPENVTYTTDHFEYTLPIIRDRIALKLEGSSPDYARTVIRC